MPISEIKEFKDFIKKQIIVFGTHLPNPEKARILRELADELSPIKPDENSDTVRLS